MVQIRHECDCKTCSGGESPPSGQYGGWRCSCACHHRIKWEYPSVEEIQEYIKRNQLKPVPDRYTELMKCAEDLYRAMESFDNLHRSEFGIVSHEAACESRTLWDNALSRFQEFKKGNTKKDESNAME